MNILREIADRARERVAEKKRTVPLTEIAAAARLIKTGAADDFPFERALRTDGMSFICEVKRASPSGGMFAREYPYAEIAAEYEAAGAAAVSVLTEPYYFLGRDEHLKEIAAAVKLPLLRKDFVVDEYMIYEAKILGANAVLLITALTDTVKLAGFVETAHGLGLSALVETRDESEIDAALNAGARIIGVNNRDLTTFAVDTGRSARLRRRVPDSVLFVSESGVKTARDVEELRRCGVDAVLVGEALMRAPDKMSMLNSLRR